jgi:hypothetical protein
VSPRQNRVLEKKWNPGGIAFEFQLNSIALKKGWIVKPGSSVGATGSPSTSGSRFESAPGPAASRKRKFLPWFPGFCKKCGNHGATGRSLKFMEEHY